jgi:5,10-methylenetetrahydromethanopterin reductase
MTYSGERRALLDLGPAVSIGVYPTASLRALGDLARLVDNTRIDTLWIGDSPLIWRECWSAIAWIGALTESIRLGPSVTNPASRHPAITAATVATLQEATSGRIRLGIGVGDSAVRMLYGRVSKLAELETAVGLIRRLLVDGRAIEGERTLTLPVTWPATEIAVSGSGPKTLASAGRLGDVAIIVPGVLGERVAAANAVVAAGAVEAGRDPRAVERILWVACAVEDDEEAALDRVRPWVASVLRHPLAFDLPPEVQAIQASIREAYDFQHHMAGSAAHRKLVPDDLVRQFALAGRPEQVREGLSALSALPNIDEIALVLLGPSWTEEAQAVLSILEMVPAARQLAGTGSAGG